MNQREYNRRYSRKLVARRRREGLCTECGAVLVEQAAANPNKSRTGYLNPVCVPCRVKMHERQRAYRQRIKERAQANPAQVRPVNDIPAGKRHAIIGRWRKDAPERYALFFAVYKRALQGVLNLQLTPERREQEIRTIEADAFYVALNATDCAAELAWFAPGLPVESRNCSMTGLAIREYGEAA